MVTRSSLQSLLLSHTSDTFPRSGFTKEEYDIAGMERKEVETLVLSNLTVREEDQLDTAVEQEELENNLQARLGEIFSCKYASCWG